MTHTPLLHDEEGMTCDSCRVLNGSSCALARKCMRKFYWRRLHGGTGIVRKDWFNKNLAFGSAVHEGLAQHYIGVVQEDPGEIASRDFLARVPDSLYSLEPPVYDEMADLAKRMLTAYCDPNERKPDRFDKIISVEQPFNVVLGDVCWRCGKPYERDECPYCESNITKCPYCESTVYRYVGKPDLIAIEDGITYSFDHKTLSGYNEGSWEAWRRSFSQIGYLYGTRKATGLDIRGFQINGLQKLKTIGMPWDPTRQCPDCHNGKRKKLTCQTCNQTGRVPKIATKPEPFRRKEFLIEQAHIELWMLSTFRLLRDLEREALLMQKEPNAAYRMDDTACGSGDYSCMYSELCWDTSTPQYWWEQDDPPQGYEKRPADYVDDLIEEERQ